MALNNFTTVAEPLTTTNTILYTAPIGYTSIILMAQVTNVTSTEQLVTFAHYDNNTATENELCKDFPLAGNDSMSVTAGKLVLEAGNSVKAFAGANNALKITISVLESLNA